MTAKKDSKANKFELGEFKRNQIASRILELAVRGLVSEALRKSDFNPLKKWCLWLKAFSPQLSEVFTTFPLLFARFTLRQAAES